MDQIHFGLNLLAQSQSVGVAFSIVFAFIVSLFVLGFLLVPFTPVFIWYFSRRRISKHLNWLQSTYPAPKSAGPPVEWNGFPVVRAMFDGHPIQVVTSYKTGKTPNVRVFAVWPYYNFRLSVSPEFRGAEKMKKFRGLQDIQIGNPEFDNAFVIQSSDPASLGFVLNHQVQTQLLRMRGDKSRRNNRNDTPPELRHFSVADRSLMVDAEMPVTPSQLEMQIRCVICLRDAMVEGTKMLAAHRALPDGKRLSVSKNPPTAPVKKIKPKSPKSLEFVEAQMVGYGNPAIQIRETAEDPVWQINCLVCGEGIAGEYLNCKRCATPHHADCWNYIGRCSIFACGCKKAKRVQC